jgi:hypothetical protein
MSVLNTFTDFDDIEYLNKITPRPTYPKIRSPGEIPLQERNQLWGMMTGKPERKFFITLRICYISLTASNIAPRVDLNATTSFEETDYETERAKDFGLSAD